MQGLLCHELPLHQGAIFISLLVPCDVPNLRVQLFSNDPSLVTLKSISFYHLGHPKLITIHKTNQVEDYTKLSSSLPSFAPIVGALRLA